MKKIKKTISSYSSQEICDIINKSLKLEPKLQIFPFTLSSWKKQGIFQPRGKKKQNYYSTELEIILKLAYLIKVLKYEVKDIKEHKQKYGWQ